MSKPSSTMICLRIIQINDVYELDKLANLKSLIDHYSLKDCGSDVVPADKTLVFLAGDFLAPSLLSSLDQGRGMVDVLNIVGVTHVCFGNHECDIPIHALPARIEESRFEWINTNMREIDEKLGIKTKAYDVVTVKNQNGENERKVAILGFLTDEPSLYQKGTFGDEYKINPIMESTREIIKKLNKIGDIDIIIPMTHQDIAEDKEYAKEFNDVFRIIVGGHDHEVYDEIVDGCRIAKTGSDAHNAFIIDINWSSENDNASASVSAKLIPTDSFPPDEKAVYAINTHKKILEKLDDAKLFRIDACKEYISHAKPRFNCMRDENHRFSTRCNRLRPSSGSEVMCSVIRHVMSADCALINAGCIRGDLDYSGRTWFTFADLRREMPFDEYCILMPLPGAVLRDVIAYSRQGAYAKPPIESGGYMQTCDALKFNDITEEIDNIRGAPFDPEKVYHTVLPLGPLKGIDDNTPLLEYVKDKSYKFSDEAGRPMKEVIIEYFVASIWMQIGSFADIDCDNDGFITDEELQTHCKKVFGYEVGDIMTKNIMAVADHDGDGKINCAEMLATQYMTYQTMSDELDMDRAKLKSLAKKIHNTRATTFSVQKSMEEAEKIAEELLSRMVSLP